MNTPYVRKLDAEGKVIFPPEGVRNLFPSRRGERRKNRKGNNRKATIGRLKVKQTIVIEKARVKMAIFQQKNNPNPIQTWVKSIMAYKTVVHNNPRLTIN